MTTVVKRARERPTHFLSIPLGFSSQFKDNYERFITYLQSNYGGGVNSGIQPFNSLHLTLGVMNLNEPDKLAHACKVLLNDIHVDCGRVQVAIDQLDYFGTGPNPVRILYGRPRGPDLVEICTRIRQVFIDAGLIERSVNSKNQEEGELRLHCTFLRLKKKRDMTEFIQQANQSDLVTNLLPLVQCPSLCICKMTQQQSLGGGYRVEAQLPLSGGG